MLSIHTTDEYNNFEIQRPRCAYITAHSLVKKIDSLQNDSSSNHSMAVLLCYHRNNFIFYIIIIAVIFTNSGKRNRKKKKNINKSKSTYLSNYFFPSVFVFFIRYDLDRFPKKRPLQIIPYYYRNTPKDGKIKTYIAPPIDRPLNYWIVCRTHII